MEKAWDAWPAHDQDWNKYWSQWKNHAHEMAKEQKAKGVETHVVVKKAWEDGDTRPYAGNHKLVTKEQARAEYDPPDQLGDKERLIVALNKSDAKTIVEETDKQPLVVAEIAENVFTGGCSHIWRMRHGYNCETCDEYLTYAGTFACHTKSVLLDKRKYEMVKDVDAMVARAKGEDFANLATAKGWLSPNEAHVKLVHICINCAEKIEFLPQAFESGKLIDPKDPIFDECPRIYHTQDGKEWKSNRKWRRAATQSISPASDSERARTISGIMEGIARDAAKNGQTNMKSADEMKKEFNEAEQKLVERAADWIMQLTPQTGKEGGAAIMYAHRCDIAVAKLLQPKRIVEEIEKRIRSGEMLAAPLKHSSWWLTIGHHFVEQNKQRQEEWAKMCRENIPRYLAGQGWNFTMDDTSAKWLCPVCAGTHCPSTDLQDRLLTLAGMEGFLNDKVPACVMARIGDYNFNQKYTYKEWPGINIEVFINTLRTGVLLKEINGRPLRGNTTIIEAIGVLHEKAQTFFKAHFADKIVTFEACDFRLDPKNDRTGRVAVCEDKRLSLQHVGQEVPAIMLDVQDCEPLTAAELLDILVTLSSFYDIFVTSPTKAQKPVVRMLDAEVPARREQIARNMDHVALSLGQLAV